MSAPTDNEIDSAAFLGMLRAWMKDSGTTYRDLAEKLHLSSGTVKNWLCAGKPITAKNRAYIQEIMAAPADGSRYPNMIRIPRKLAHLPLWMEAAGVTVPAFTGPEADAEQARRFAEWATPVIMSAAREAMKSQKEGILIRMSKETSCAIYPGFSDTRAADTASSVCLPVLEGAYRPLFVAMAAGITRKAEAAFIADALDQAAEAVLKDRLNEFLEGGE